MRARADGNERLEEVRIQDLEPGRAAMRAEVLAGLRATPKTVPTQYLYDARGADLFEELCEQPEYYLSRVEEAILRENADDISESIGPDARVIEPGSGEGTKSKILLAGLRRPAAYVPIDMARTQLVRLANEVSEEFEGLQVLPVCADFTATPPLPEPPEGVRRSVVFFPGATIGNFEPRSAARVLRRLSGLAGPDGALLVGVDLKKDKDLLEPAYDDERGVSRELARNLLLRLNRELDADFRLDAFDYEAPYDARRGRVARALVSRCAQTVHVGDEEVRFAEGERLRTEDAYKYDLAGFARLASRAGLRAVRTWSDPEGLYSLQLLSRSRAA